MYKLWFCFQLHFDESQHELHRLDGKRPLKGDALPSIFFHTTIAVRKPPKQHPEHVTEIVLPPSTDHNYAATSPVDEGILKLYKT
jgi:hypothetical protein